MERRRVSVLFSLSHKIMNIKDNVIQCEHKHKLYHMNEKLFQRFEGSQQADTEVQKFQIFSFCIHVYVNCVY